MRSEKPSKELLFSQPIQWWFVVSSTILNAGLVIVDRIFSCNFFPISFIDISFFIALIILKFWNCEMKYLINFKVLKYFKILGVEDFFVPAKKINAG